MRTSVKLGAGLTSAAIVASLAAGVAAATVSGPQRAATASLAATSSAHITMKQAKHLARAAVPHSRVIEIESDDFHDRAVWKVKLATPHGRVVVVVDKKTGMVTILGHRHGGGHDDVLLSARSAMLILAGEHRGIEPGEDRGIEQEPGEDQGIEQEPGEDRGIEQEPGEDQGIEQEPGDDRGVDQHADDHGQNRGPGNGGQDDGPGQDSGHGGSGLDG